MKRYTVLTLTKHKKSLLKEMCFFCSGHQEVLRNEGKCSQFDPVPLVLVKDIMNYMPQMKYMINNMAATATDQPAAKRLKVS